MKSRDELLQLAGIDMESLSYEAAYRSYQTGLALFHSGSHEQAAEHLTKSRELHQNSYFADDNLFYLMESKRKLLQTEELGVLYDEFLNSESVHYQNSPYYDDVMLHKALALAEWSHRSEAEKLLQEIIDRFPDQWTARKASSIIQKLAEERE